MNLEVTTRKNNGGTYRSMITAPAENGIWELGASAEGSKLVTRKG
jgi:hypothetical protein